MYIYIILPGCHVHQDSVAEPDFEVRAVSSKPVSERASMHAGAEEDEQT